MHSEAQQGRGGSGRTAGVVAEDRYGDVPDEGALLVAAHGGSADAWAALVDRYAATVWRWARLALPDDTPAAEQVSAMTWLRLVEALAPVPLAHLDTWLAATVRAEASAHRRAVAAQAARTRSAASVTG